MTAIPERPNWVDDLQSDAAYLPPEVDYPEDHSPFCHRDCTHPCHDAYDEWARKNGRGGDDG